MTTLPTIFEGTTGHTVSWAQYLLMRLDLEQGRK